MSFRFVDIAIQQAGCILAIVDLKLLVCVAYMCTNGLETDVERGCYFEV